MELTRDDDDVAAESTQLLDASYTPSELFAGKFRASELRHDAHFDAPALQALGYVPKELREAGFDAPTLKQSCGYDASELRGGGRVHERLVACLLGR